MFPGSQQRLDWLDSTFDIDLAQVRGWFTQGSREALQSLASLGGKVFLGAVGTVVGFVLMVFMLFFFIRDGDEMVRHAARADSHVAETTRASCSIIWPR